MMSSVALVGIVGVVCLVASGLVVWAFMAARLRVERLLRERERAAAALVRESDERRVQAFVEGALERFKTVSSDALKVRGDEFRALNAGELEQILRPLKESVAHYEEAARKSQEKTDRLEARMNDHMAVLGAAAERFKTGSTDFVNAITGGNKVAGNWGEAVLGQVLSDCGLVKDIHYIVQGGGTGNIPDCQVFDATSRKILVIDAKVSWKKFKEMSESENPAVRTAALDEHVASVRRQIDVLSGKRYHENPNPPRAGFQYLPFSAMFVPSDAALWEAVKRDPSIPAYAYGKRVVLVTPTSLFGFMRLVHEGWALYSTQRNQERIAREANLVVERIDRLFKCLEDADRAYEKAHEQLAQAMRLASGEGLCIKGPALKIIRLREKTEKALKSRTLTEASVPSEADVAEESPSVG